MEGLYGAIIGKALYDGKINPPLSPLLLGGHQGQYLIKNRIDSSLGKRITPPAQNKLPMKKLLLTTAIAGLSLGAAIAGDGKSFKEVKEVIVDELPLP